MVDTDAPDFTEKVTYIGTDNYEAGYEGAKEFGTRHRAGIGITEVANVVSLVVSEETGIISVIKQGNVQRYADYDILQSALRDYYWQELPLSDRKDRRISG